MRVACEYQAQQDSRRHGLGALVESFHGHLGTGSLDPSGECALLPSPTPIQAVLVPGNARCTRVAAALQASGLDVRPLRPPTVPAGKERLRVVLHWHNTEAEVARLAGRLKEELGVGVGDTERKAAAAVVGGLEKTGAKRGHHHHHHHHHQQPPAPVAAAAAAVAAAAPAAVSRL